ncbi:MAG TPA: hypothetical protein VGN37_28790 [Actinocatenispora sp.]
MLAAVDPTALPEPGLRGRPTSIAYRVGAGTVLGRSMTLRLSDFGAPLTVAAPHGAAASLAPTHFVP